MNKPAAKHEARSESKQVAPAGSHAMAEVPDYVKQGTTRGTEQMRMEDITIPRIEIAQALSPVLKKNDPAYIAGIEEGDLFNTITRENYGPLVIVVPVFFKIQWLLWDRTKRTTGGGFRGAFDTELEAKGTIKGIKADEHPENFDVIMTYQYFCLRMDDATGRTEEVMLSLARTKWKAGKAWNALIRMNRNDIFSRCYNVFSIDAKNDKGTFKNYQVQTLAFTPLEAYKEAEALCEKILSGARKVQADMSSEPDGEVVDSTATAAGAETEY